MMATDGAGERTVPTEIVATYRAAYAAWEVAKGTAGEFSAWCAVVRASDLAAYQAARSERKAAKHGKH